MHQHIDILYDIIRTQYIFIINYFCLVYIQNRYEAVICWPINEIIVLFFFLLTHYQLEQQRKPSLWSQFNSLELQVQPRRSELIRCNVSLEQPPIISWMFTFGNSFGISKAFLFSSSFYKCLALKEAMI